jgi:hypothetical protein
MGKLTYGDSGIQIDIDDRSMMHLQIVIGTKLRRGESFFFSWGDDPQLGTGRTSLWMDPSIPLFFKFFGSKASSVNREWIAALTDSANGSQGLIFTAEPGEKTPVPRGRF